MENAFSWSIFITTFITIFLAELGDKTQLAAIAAAGHTKSTISVLLGTVIALMLAGILGVGVGTLIGQSLNPEKMKYFSGVLFIAIGLWTLVKS